MMSKRRLGLTIPQNLYQRLSEKASYQGKTLNAMCLEIFWEYFDEKEKMKVEVYREKK